MGQEFGFAYAAISAFCMIFAIIVYSKTNDDIGSEREITYFKRLLVAYIVFTSSETVWAIGNFHVVELPVPVLSLMSTITLISVGFLAFYWFAYGETKMGYTVVGRPVMRFIIYLPLIIVTVLYIVSMWNGIMFSYDKNGMFIHGPLYDTSIIFDDIYLVVVSVHALIKAAREPSPARRREYITLVSFIILPTLAGVIDTIVPTMPLMAPALFTSILLVFANTQESQIFNDALTGLNNRRRADVYLEELVPQADESPFYVFIIDADRFKEINDTYGHIEGDHALGVMAQALRNTGQICNGFVARWGGDEFLLIAREENIESPEWVSTEIEKQLHAIVTKENLKYEMRATAGWTRCDNPALTQDVLIRAADAMLYERKQLRRGTSE